MRCARACRPGCSKRPEVSSVTAMRSSVTQYGETPDRRARMAYAAVEAGRPERAAPIIERAIAAGDPSPFVPIAAGRAAVVTGDADRALAYAERVIENTDDIDARLSAL